MTPTARILTDLATVTFDRVDRVKKAVGDSDIRPGDHRFWILGQALDVDVTWEARRYGENQEARVWSIRVPAGFVTDGASVPDLAQLLTRWFPWDEPQRWAAIVHDWCYCVNGRVDHVGDDPYHGPQVPKVDADRAFRATLKAAGASRLRSTVMYWAVRVFGGHAYRVDQVTGPKIYT